MIINYLKSAFANIYKNKAFSIISISSLAVGMAVCILLLLYVTDELSYDRYHEKADNIYRLCQEEHPYQAPGTPVVLTESLPEIESYARILPRDEILIEVEEQRFKENFVAWVDASLFEIFSFKNLQGNAQESLKHPNTIVLNETTARKYFGNENAIGKQIIINGEQRCTVTGIIEDIPQNSHFKFDIFISLANGNELYGDDWLESWGWWNFLVYFEMQDDFAKTETEAKISKIMEQYSLNPEGPYTQFTIQSLKDIHLHSSHFLGDIQPQNSITYVLIFAAIAFLILFIACFNYVNLFTANATTRLTEISVRKSFGASRRKIAMQFNFESMVMFFISFFVALILVRITMPLFNSFSEKMLSFSLLGDIKMILLLLGMMFLISVIAGWYPSMVLSSYSPTEVLRSTRKTSSGFQVKNLFVGAQFTIVIALVACAIIMFKQVNYLENKDLGFDKEAVITAVFDYGDEEKYNTLRNELLGESFVTNVSVASRIPSGSLSNEGYIRTESQTEAYLMPYVHVHYDYFQTLGIEPVQGRLFSEEFKTDAKESIILNLAAVKKMDIQGDPIGEAIRCGWPRSNRRVVGVIDDIHFESLYNKIKPVVYVINYPDVYHMIVKVEANDLVVAKQQVSEICQRLYPDEVITFSFLDSILESRYSKDVSTFNLMSFFAGLAIFLACMGLLGVSIFIISRRTKEIGIRKVNGATVPGIIHMLNMGFLKLVAISFIIAIPIVYYGMSRWLESFAFRTSLSWWVFALAGLLTAVIVLSTVSWVSFRAARRNPVEALRYE
jgi:putative ABC transport system permease protein